MLQLIAICLLIIGQALSKNGCRACEGTQSLTFSAGITQEAATSFLVQSVLGCATGDEYQIDRIDRGGCQTDCLREGGVPPDTQCAAEGPQKCHIWLFNIKIWRYCGNGGLLTLRRGSYCDKFSICSLTDTLTLTCHKSVECHTKCDCSKCGC